MEDAPRLERAYQHHHFQCMNATAARRSTVSLSASSEKPQCLIVGPTRPNNRSWPLTVPVKCRHQKNGVSNVQTSPSTICNRCRLRTKDRTVSTQTVVPSRRMTKRRPLKIPSGRMLPRSSPSTSKIGVVPGWGWIRNTGVPGDRSETSWPAAARRTVTRSGEPISMCV